MSFLSTKGSLFARLKTGLFSGAGRGGPGRLLAIVGVGALMAALLVIVSISGQNASL